MTKHYLKIFGVCAFYSIFVFAYAIAIKKAMEVEKNKKLWEFPIEQIVFSILAISIVSLLWPISYAYDVYSVYKAKKRNKEISDFLSGKTNVLYPEDWSDKRK